MTDALRRFVPVGNESHVVGFEVVLQILLFGNSSLSPRRAGYRHAHKGDTGVVAFLFAINFLFFPAQAETVPKVELRQKPGGEKTPGQLRSFFEVSRFEVRFLQSQFPFGDNFIRWSVAFLIEIAGGPQAYIIWFVR